MRNKRFSKILFFPIVVLLAFLLFSEVLYFIGPLEYSSKGNVWLFFYLVLLNISLYWGYRYGIVIKIRSVKKQRFKIGRRVRFFSARTVRVIIIAALVVYVFKYIFELHIHSLSAFVEKVIYAVLNSGDVYKDKLDASVPTMMTYVFMLLSPIPFLAQTLGICYWKRLSFFFKCLVVIVFVLEISTWLASGTRKGILDVLIVIGTMLLLLDPGVVTDKQKSRKFRIAVVLSIAVFVLYFVVSNLSRYGIAASDYTSYSIDSIKPFYKRVFPLSVNMVLSNIADYLCQGYYALSLALHDFLTQGVFRFTYGFGSSWFDINIAENLFNFNPLPHTYQGYLAATYGIDEMAKWHTLYLWLANDFTFIGTPVVIFGLGYLASCVWFDALFHRNKFAAPLFALCALCVFYAFANNQVLSFNFVPFFFMLFLYILHNPVFGVHKKKKVRISMAPAPQTTVR